MRKHEMVYCFANKSPEYDVSSHKEGGVVKDNRSFQTSKSVDLYGTENTRKTTLIVGKDGKGGITHNDPLPTSDITPPTPEHELVYCFAKKSPEYDVSSHKEGGVVKDNRSFQTLKSVDLYGTENTRKTTLIVGKDGKGGITHNDLLPTSDITPPELNQTGHAEMYGIKKTGKRNRGKKDQDPLPTSDITPPTPEHDLTFDLDEEPSSWCEFKNDEKTGHRTAKPVALMEFLLKYWTKPDATVLDPTMGSGSMGIACKNMGRKFIGIEMDKDIYDLAVKRIG